MTFKEQLRRVVASLNHDDNSQDAYKILYPIIVFFLGLILLYNMVSTDWEETEAVQYKVGKLWKKEDTGSNNFYRVYDKYEVDGKWYEYEGREDFRTYEDAEAAYQQDLKGNDYWAIDLYYDADDPAHSTISPSGVFW